MWKWERSPRHSSSPTVQARSSAVSLPTNSVRSACQRAALTAVFPIIEECRFRFICRHRDAIAQHLPIRNIGGELIDDPYDLEIGPLNYLVRYQPLLQTLEGSELIRLCAAVRNQIAHNKPVQPETLRVLREMTADQR